MTNQASIGEIIESRYELLELLGEGGMGRVFKARQIGLERIVAIKLLHSSLLGDKDSLLRFEREGKILSELSHKHILGFYSFATWQGGKPYIVMEFIDGTNLANVLNKEQAISWQRALNIGLQICDAMQTAHTHGIINRDLKPNNIMLLSAPTADFVKIIDFGLAKLLNSASNQKLTQTGALIGSIHYLSPEQCLGMPTDHRSDIYSLACIIYECIAGKPPLDADNPVGLVHKHAYEVPLALTSICQDKELPVNLDNVLFKAMAKNPKDRYQTMEDFRADLELLLSGQGSQITAQEKPWTNLLPYQPGTKNSKQLVFFTLVTILIILVPALLLCWQDPGFVRPLAWYFKNQEKAIGQQNCLNTAQWCRSNGRPQGARILFLEALRLDENIDNTEKLSLFSQLADVCQTSGNKAESLWFAQKALDILLTIKKQDGALHNSELTDKYLLPNLKIIGTGKINGQLEDTLFALPVSFLQEENLKAIIAIHRTVLQAGERYGGLSQRTKAYSYMHVGEAYAWSGDSKQGEACLLKAVAILQKTPERNLDLLCHSQNSLADCYTQQNLFSQAEEYYQKSIDCYEAINQPARYYCLLSKEKLINLLIDTRKIDKAKALLKGLNADLAHCQEASIFERIDLYRDLASIYGRLSMDEEAEQTLLDALHIAIYERAVNSLRDYSKFHQVLGDSYHEKGQQTSAPFFMFMHSSLGDFYMAHKRYKEAAANYEKALLFLRKSKELSRPLITVTLLAKLTVAEAAAGNERKAKAWLAAMERADKNLPEYKQLNIALAHYQESNGYRALHQWKEAESELRLCLQSFDQIGHQDWPRQKIELALDRVKKKQVSNEDSPSLKNQSREDSRREFFGEPLLRGLNSWR